MEHMQQHMGYPVFWTNQTQRPPVLTHSSMYPPLPPFPDFRKKRRKEGTCVYLFIIFLLVLLALTGVGISTYKIMELQKKVDQVKETSADAISMSNPSTEKLTGEPQEKKVSRQAAHVTGKESPNLPLIWEDSKGRAFTNGIQYRNRGLVVNETGLHFLYSSIYFRSTNCPKDPMELTHVVYKKPSRYPGVMKLMESTEQHNCKPLNTWARHSYLGAVFNLTRDDVLYVNVSDVALVSNDETKSFFGLYKL
ncbi:PREDICTED: tumor necrosis factor ligand superfamily member 6 [Nanorana parkeri]|uniref:tumor necrosis factor ligand superfamily member 6 n=1 Tax=Nanorana parkeri TaxID=125878 RepID=UPI0008545E16|nr:PREDICTED: tumor necrosis factor ligand superfamily member 6 [Nanorana parkeri]